MSQESLDAWAGENEELDRKSSSEVVPERCLSFTVSGPWAHFRRVEGNIVKQTYRIMPRTTVAGLVAAIMGIGRDQYYDLFGPETSAVAIEPVEPLRTINLPQNTLSTADEHISRVPSHSRTLKVGLPDPTELRQQHNYEVLVDPAYRIDLWFDDTERYETLREYLERGESHYVPSLGLSEYLAEIEYHGEFEVREGPKEDVVSVDSAVPEAVNSIVAEAGTKYGIERSPAFMESSGGGRTTTGFTAYAYNQAGGLLSVRDVKSHRVDDRTVMFV